jgi:branched-chain amino acid transport system ATP-binding protein
MMEGNPMQAKRIIEEEHRSLAAVLYGMLYVVREIRYVGIKPDFALLEAMVHYVDTFLERLHHPKEDAYLFKLLGSRYPGAAPLLDRLKQEHESGSVKLRQLRLALARYQHDGHAQFPEFAAIVADFAVFHWEHMRLEETELLPLATRHLTDADWDAIDAAFLEHANPLLGAEQGKECRDLFRRIVDLAPRPIGLAPVR